MMQQIAKTLDVVQEVLLTVCTVKDNDEKEQRMKKCAEKIAKNREDAAMACKTQLKQHQSKTTDKSAQSTSINHKTVQFE